MRHRRLSYRLILQVHSFGKEVNPNSRLVGKTKRCIYSRIYTCRLEWGGSINKEGEREREGKREGERERERERREGVGMTCGETSTCFSFV